MVYLGNHLHRQLRHDSERGINLDIYAGSALTTWNSSNISPLLTYLLRTLRACSWITDRTCGLIHTSTLIPPHVPDETLRHKRFKDLNIVCALAFDGSVSAVMPNLSGSDAGTSIDKCFDNIRISPLRCRQQQRGQFQLVCTFAPSLSTVSPDSEMLHPH